MHQVGLMTPRVDKLEGFEFLFEFEYHDPEFVGIASWGDRKPVLLYVFVDEYLPILILQVHSCLISKVFASDPVPLWLLA